MEKTTDHHGPGRRDVLLGAGALAAGSAAGWFGRGFADTPSSDPAPVAEDRAERDEVRRWVTTQVTLASTTVGRRSGDTAPGLLFSALDTGVHRGVISDDTGEPVWIETGGLDVYDLRVQQYRGAPVLTYTSGLLQDGYGIMTGSILDTSYRTIATVHAGNGLSADLHEFLLTPQDTALLCAYPVVPGDLSAVGGPTDGWFLDCHAQEVDVATGALLLDWRASDHLALTESRQAVGDDGSVDSPWDPFHVNACFADGDDAVLVSARHTHAVYSIDRSTGDVRWRLGGERSDFELGDDAVFAWQHHVTRQSPTRLTLFDNASKDGSAAARGLVLEVDEDAKTVRLDTEYRHGGRKGTAMGSTQQLDGGHVLVGWGTGKGLTEFTADGEPVLDLTFGGASYRSFRHTWTATPARPPAVATRTTAGTTRAHASWNGSTETASWRFDHGATRDALTSSVATERSGFETAVALPAGARWVRATAVGADGADLASSGVVAVSA